MCSSHQAWWWKTTRQASPLGKALSAFWKLDRVWKFRASLQQKAQLFIAPALSVLLYGCESSVLTSDLCRQIDSFQTSCIRIVLGVSLTDHVGNEEVYDRTGTVSFSQSLQALQIRFLGHCLRRPKGDQKRSVYTSNQDLVDVNSISRVCCKANQSWKTPVRQEIRALAPDRKAWKRKKIDCWHCRKPPLAPHLSRERCGTPYCYSSWVPRTADTLSLIQVTVDEVSNLLKTLKVNKATGPDKLPNVVLKKCADALAPSLTLFFNLGCLVGCTPLNENVLTSPLLIKRMIKTKWTTIVLFPYYQRYLSSKSTALPHVSFLSSGTVSSLYNMVSCRENLARLNSFK